MPTTLQEGLGWPPGGPDLGAQHNGSTAHLVLWSWPQSTRLRTAAGSAHGFRFKNKLYAVDASTIGWRPSRGRRSGAKGAIKLHVGVDQAGHLPTFISVTDGKTGDVTVARTWTFPAGSVVVADRAYLDFGWLHQLQQRGVTFVDPPEAERALSGGA